MDTSADGFFWVVEERHSCRSYDPEREVEPEKLARIVEAGRLAPSACNSQPWHIVTVTDPANRARIAGALSSMGMNGWCRHATAFLVIVQEAPNFTARLGTWIKSKQYPDMDCGILAGFLSLSATALGLGSCIVGWFDEKAVLAAIEAPRRKRIPMVIALGYPAAPLKASPRKPLEQVSSAERY